MQKLFLSLIIFVSIAGNAQSTLGRIAELEEIIEDVDHIELNEKSVKTIIFRRLVHNETTITHRFLVDTSTFEIHKSEYFVSTLLTSKDTVAEVTAFYSTKGQFAVVRYKKTNNGREVASGIFYIESVDGEVKEIEAMNTRQTLKEREISYQAKDLWTSGQSIKDWLRKKNGG
jgi:hypothetical protein